jgi:hypothetical protein
MVFNCIKTAGITRQFYYFIMCYVLFGVTRVLNQLGVAKFIKWYWQ